MCFIIAVISITYVDLRLDVFWGKGLVHILRKKSKTFSITCLALKKITNNQTKKNGREWDKKIKKDNSVKSQPIKILFNRDLKEDTKVFFQWIFTGSALPSCRALTTNTQFPLCHKPCRWIITEQVWECMERFKG